MIGFLAWSAHGAADKTDDFMRKLNLKNRLFGMATS